MSLSKDQQLNTLINEWMQLDKNEQTRKELEELVQRGEKNELYARMFEKLTFGTAGLRGAMGVGYARMNDLTVIQASQGLCTYLVNHMGEDLVKNMGVVIGHDHRHNSDRFARLTASIFLHKGIKVYFFKRLVHTPLVPFTVERMKTAAGIMITASHNPKQDNGYKVYWCNGAQIISPHDKGIAKCINENQVPWLWDDQMVLNSPLSIDPFEKMFEHYFSALEKLSFRKRANELSKLRFVYTPIHGVGLDFAREAFKRFGFVPFLAVKEQENPDPEFPTVSFPNPEEGKGTLKLAISAAMMNDISIVLANDPDADRFAIAEMQKNGEWYVFNGNQIGILLAWYLWQNWQAKFPGNEKAHTIMMASTVSSKMLKRFAEVEGFKYEETLTGFKWMGNRTVEYEKEKMHVLFAYEEAIGFMCGSAVKDKDGISALAVFAELSATIYETGLCIYQQLDELYRKYGYFISKTHYFICYSQSTIRKIFDRLRFGEDNEDGIVEERLQRRSFDIRIAGKEYKVNYPIQCGRFKIHAIRDLTIGFDSSENDFQTKLPISSSSQMITFTFNNNATATLRTSGTEPKIKYYIEYPGDFEHKEHSQQILNDLVQLVIDEFLEPRKNGFDLPKDSS